MLIFITVLFGFIIILYIFSPLISPTKLKINGLHILITGGSSGIGKFMAIEAVKQGANITILSRNKNKLLDAKNEIELHMQNKNIQITCVSIDVSKDYMALKKAILQAEELMGRCVDILVNCAGYACMGEFDVQPIDNFKNLMDINFMGTVYATRAVIDGMKRNKSGRIMFVSSQAGQLGIFGCTAYCASKFALRGLAESLQMELKPYEIRITMAFPPDTDTPGYAQENLTKPEITKCISQTSGLFSPQVVAKSLLEDMKTGRFNSYIGMDGYMLNSVTCGMSPITSITEAIQQVCTMAVFRIVGLFYIDCFDRMIKAAANNNNSSTIQTQSSK